MVSISPPDEKISNRHAEFKHIKALDEESVKPLNVAIAGAGIGGLTAAIALRRQGHNVTLYEASPFSNEIGAAFHLAPNANGILRRYGIFAEEGGAVVCCGFTNYHKNGEAIERRDLRKINSRWEWPWHLAHRIRLHDYLKRTALSTDYINKPAVLKNSAKVTHVDADSGTLTFENGTTVSADVVIGADGIYSKTRAEISQAKLFSTGRGCFRFLISRKDAQADPLCAKYVENNDEMLICYSDDRRVVMYPVNDNETLNFVCIHPEVESHGDGTSTQWSVRANVSQMLKVYESFGEGIKALLKKADPESIKVWKLMDMEVLPEWTKGRLALLGDAAHPFLPYLGQGGGMAIEDAASIGVVLPLGTLPEEVPNRLKLYEEIRKTRADTIQEQTRQAGSSDFDGNNKEKTFDRAATTAFCQGHDELANSTKIFEEWLKAEQIPAGK